MSVKSKRTGYADSAIQKSEPTGAGTWSEWSDSDLNAEPWDHPKSGDFGDPQQVEMPPSLQPTKWKRFQNLKNVINPIVFEPIFSYPDLITNNRHLMHSEFTRCFISTLINVQYCGRDGLEIENPTKNFSWNFADQCWQPWYHVYSLNKAGKGVQHRPVFNPKGRYVVRLFVMGHWRRILVDDSIPVDKRGRPLLPRTANNDELWPMILAKAMLKVAALSWTSSREIAHCSLISCLTGWICLSLNVSHLSPRDQWEFLTKYAKHFEWSKGDQTEVVPKKSIDRGKGSKRKSKDESKKIQVPDDPRPTVLFLSLEDMRNVDAEEIPGITPCWNHQIYVELSRDVPLDPSQVKPPLASWKLHRWLDWAIDRGLIDPSEYFVPTRHLLIVSPLRECKTDVVYAYDGIGEEDLDDDSSRTTVASRERPPEKTRDTATQGSSKDTRRGSSMPDITLWGDFNKLSLYLREIHLFYKQRFFKYATEVSDGPQSFWNDGKKRKSETTTADGKNSRKSVTPGTSTPAKSYEYQDRLLQSRNEPLYLFVDSTEDKFFLVNLSTVIASRDASNNSRATKDSYLIVEKHNWFNEPVENPLDVEIITRGTKSTVFQAERGRHLLRIFISSECSYHVTILSDTPFQIGNRLKMHDLMTTESESVAAVVRNISTCVKKAFESFGGSSYAACLKLYYQSYMPDSSQFTENSEKKSLKSIHWYFIEEFVKLLEEVLPQSEWSIVHRALRVFFLDPSIGRPIEEAHYFRDEKSWQSIEAAECTEYRSATTVQSFFRMIVIKRYKKIHETGDAEHDRVKEALLKIVELFNRDSDESVAQKLLRAVVKRDNIFASLYPCASDFKHVIQIQELKGKISNVLPEQWIPIVRVVFNASKSEKVLAALDLFTNLSNYTLRVFANDTGREMLRTGTNVAPVTYRHRKSGYTVFAHGRNDVRGFRELEWSLHMTTIKGEPTFHWPENGEPIPIATEIAPLTIREISNNYIPNVRNRILKLVGKIENACLATLRLKTSYENVMTAMRVINETGETIAEIEGGATVILPLVFLKHVASNETTVQRESQEKIRISKISLSKKNGDPSNHRFGDVFERNSNDDNERVENCTRYFIEAFVRKNSWPLTEKEWAVVAEAKSRNVSSGTKLRKSSTLGRRSKTEFRPRSKQLTKKSLEIRETFEQPYWILQIVTDSGNEFDVFPDRSKEDRIDELKRLWKTDETGRSERGSELRERFLDDNCLMIARSAIDISNGSMSYEDLRAIESAGSLHEETSSESKRTLEPPADLGNYLPKMDLSIYMEKDDEEDHSWVKTDFDEETLRNQRAMNILDFEQAQSVFHEETAVSLNNRRRKYERLFEKYLEKSASRARTVEEAYELRRNYIDATKNTSGSIKSKDGKRKN